MMWVNKLNEFLTQMKKEHVAVIYHPDADGVCSAALFAKLFRSEKIKYFLLNQKDEVAITEDTINTLKKNNIRYVIILDMSVDSDPTSYSELERAVRKVLIADHHVLKKDLSSSKTIHLNVGMVDENPESYPTSKFVYDILTEVHKNVERYGWIAAIGIIGDSSKKRWNEFLTEVCRKHKITLDILEEAALSIELCKALSYSTLELCLKNMTRSENTDEFLNSLPAEIRQLKKEFHSALNRALKNREEYEQLVFVELDSKYNLKSLMANTLSFDYFPNKTVVVIWPHNKNLHVSLRRQDGKISMDLLVRKVVEFLKTGNGGGHIPAAGGKFPLSVANKLKKAFLSIHKEFLKD